MNIAGIVFVGFVLVVTIAMAIGIISNAEERRKAQEEKELSDKDYHEQQQIHKGDC